MSTTGRNTTEQEEFQDFLSTPEVLPSANVSNHIIQRIRAELNPSFLGVFAKLCLVHLITGGLTLLVCPQFGIGPLGGGHGLLGFFMHHGTWLCAMTCGAVFLGTTAILSALTLKQEELKVVQRTQLWQFSLLAALSISLLMLVGNLAQIDVPHLTPEYVTLWLLAAILGSQIFYQASYKVRCWVG